MKRSFFMNHIQPPLEKFLGYPVIRAEQMGSKVDGPHTTYKITMPYGKGVGNPNISHREKGDSLEVVSSENYRVTISFSTYSMDDEISHEMAQNIHDWWSFHGSELLQSLGVAIINITDVDNRDTIILEGYERRYGFDVIIRHSREISKVVDFFTSVEHIRNK